jgi:UDP-N-acetylmuramoyl-tripeptide--D-alanyl-D-alanine ligase
MREWDAQRVAGAAGAELLVAPTHGVGNGAGRDGGAERASGPSGASVDNRTIAPGELFVGLVGERADGGEFADEALRAGAWGALVAPEHARAAALVAGETGGAALVHGQPLVALQALASAWRRELGHCGAKVVAITGSTGKTSTKDILAALLGGHVAVAATPANLNTEIGLPLALLGADAQARALVLEMAMRGPGQIAELTAIAEPDVGVIVNVGPAHLGLLGSLEAIAAAKAELIAGLAADATVVVPADEPLLAPHLRAELRTITFGEGGDVRMTERHADGWVAIEHDGDLIELLPSFANAHNLSNLLAAVAAARALGYTPRGRLEVSFSAMRGQCEQLPGGVLLIDDCYNANPMSMRAALDDLAHRASGRRVAVLGDMLELGPDGPALHREIGEHASACGVELLVAVGSLAAEMQAGFAAKAHSAVPHHSAASHTAASHSAASHSAASHTAASHTAASHSAASHTAASHSAASHTAASHTAADAREAGELLDGLLREGDTVLVKGSRGVGLELVSERLRGRARTLKGTPPMGAHPKGDTLKGAGKQAGEAAVAPLRGAGGLGRR